MPFVKKGDKRPEGAGRKRGNKPTSLMAARVEYICEELGLNPIEALARFAQGDVVGLGMMSERDARRDRFRRNGAKMAKLISPKLRLLALKELAQYAYPKRKAIELTGPNDGPVEFFETPGTMGKEQWERTFSKKKD